MCVVRASCCSSRYSDVSSCVNFALRAGPADNFLVSLQVTRGLIGELGAEKLSRHFHREKKKTDAWSDLKLQQTSENGIATWNTAASRVTNILLASRKSW